MNFSQLFNAGNLELLAANFIKSGVILTAGFILHVILNTIIRSASYKVLDEQTGASLSKVLTNILNIAIFAIVVLMLLGQWGIDIRPILAGAGLFGVVVGFGAQTLIRDFITGLFVLVENLYAVGDYIKVAGVEGTVVNINLRTTVLKNSDIIHVVPNSQVTTITKLPNNAKNN